MTFKNYGYPDLNLLSSSLLRGGIPRLGIKLLVVHSLGLVVPASHLGGVLVVGHIEALAKLLGTQEGQDEDVGVDAAHEDANDLAVVVALGARGGGWQGEALANGCLDGGRGRRHQVTELVSGTDDEGSESTGRQLHQVNGNDSPSALHAELLEESSGHDGRVVHKGVGVEQSTADNAADDDAEATADRLAHETNNGTASHGAQVSNDLGHGDLVGTESQLVRQHGRVQILAAVAHEVEAGHEQNKVGQQDPVALDGDLALLDEDLANRFVVASVLAGLDTHALTFTVCLSLGHHQTEGDEKDGRAGAKPEQRAPSVGGGVDETPSEGSGEEITKGILLESSWSANWVLFGVSYFKTGRYRS